ncbi:uncharacterized protein BP5553_08107 [Venustampulla echinocandica]|uniref:C6 transcription factor n=1 Tax=Venustampulla echinocandica TaxID=2656787 RepID=A0A370TFR4_9HELO|nr:uncharacterized protein BP5553_08107 [Venustampulla echinocandica]RDL33739.1 hypothetical protein BP5553_08107 [Venustampulla echinocandica]
MNTDYRIQFLLLRDEFHVIRERALADMNDHTSLQGIWVHPAKSSAEMEIEFEKLGPEDDRYLSQHFPSCQGSFTSSDNGQTPQVGPSMGNMVYDAPNSNSTPEDSSSLNTPECVLAHCPPLKVVECPNTEAKSRPRPRKGHKKSRHGCFNCKSRKIKNEYVMHAILGLAASHLGMITGEDLNATALHHRHLAILGSNEAISRAPRTGSDGDALLASCYLIAFQSTYMPDGMEETFRMLRGCTMLSRQLKLEELPMGFFCIDHFEYMIERLSNIPLIDTCSVQNAQQALAALLPTVEKSNNIEFYNHLVDITDLLAISSVRTYFKFLGVYQWIISMNNNKLREFTAPENVVSRILLIHFLAIQLVMGPIIDREFGERRCVVTLRGHLDWINSGTHILPADMRDLIEWPISVARSNTGMSIVK